MKNKYMKSIKSATLAGLVGLSSLLGTAKADGVSGDMGYIQREDTGSSYAEANVFYNLPGKVLGYTFLDLYTVNGGFFGKTTLTRELGDSGISAKVQTAHANELCSEAGFGLEAIVPTPKNLFAKVNCTPLWINGDGNEEDNLKVGYCVSLALPANMSLSSFGEANLANDKGLTWNYGEVELAKKIGNLTVGYNAGLVNSEDGKSTPEINNGVAIRYKF